MQIDGEIQIKDGSIPTTKLELPNDETKFLNGVGEFVEVANGNSGGLPSGTNGQTLRYNSSNELEASNLLNIVGAEDGNNFITISNGVDAPVFTVKQPYDANYPSILIEGNSGPGIEYKTSPYSTMILNIHDGNDSTGILNISGSYDGTGAYTIELGGVGNNGRANTKIALPALAGESDRPLIVKADGSIDAGTTPNGFDYVNPSGIAPYIGTIKYLNSYSSVAGNLHIESNGQSGNSYIDLLANDGMFNASFRGTTGSTTLTDGMIFTSSTIQSDALAGSESALASLSSDGTIGRATAGFTGTKTVGAETWTFEDGRLISIS